MTRPSAETTVAKPAAWFQNGFLRFLESYLKRHFHAIAIDRSSLQSLQRCQKDPDVPMIVYCNHPSWWDPLMAHFINHRILAPRQLYAPIDATALEQYKVFKKLGFFGVEMNSTRGAASFLKTTKTIFERPNSALWLTPEGRFADVRDNTAELMPGLPHVCSKMKTGFVLPMSLEYVFWEERLPECLIRFGEVVSLAEHTPQTKHQWADELSQRLRGTQAALAELVKARSAEPFENLLQGKQGASGVYDWSRRCKSWITGQPFQAAHGNQFAEKEDG
ncbi:lysophospholipid acyltransferase family protein [Neorhodopirellula lusitana]|nr:lysophospholipid acyltransferase family protein [Neorhodopirellula lusitana]